MIDKNQQVEQLDKQYGGTDVPPIPSEEIIPPYNKPLSEIKEREAIEEAERQNRLNDNTSNIRDFASYVWYGAMKGSNKGVAKVIDFLYGGSDVIETQAALGGLTEEEYIENWKSNQGSQFVEDRLKELEKDEQYKADMMRIASAVNKSWNEKQIAALNSMSNNTWRFGAQLAGGMAESITDITEAPKSIAINAAIGTLGIASKFGRIVTEGAADFADNYYSQFYEADLLGEERPTTKDALVNAGTGLVVQYGVHSAGKVIKSVINGVGSGMVTKSSKLKPDNIDAPMPDGVNTTIKQMGKDIVQADNPGEDIDVKMFQQKMNTEPDTKYNPSLDPRNTDTDVMSRMYDTDIKDTQTTMYVKDSMGKQMKFDFTSDNINQIKNDIKNGKIDPQVGEDLIEIETLQRKTNFVDGDDLLSNLKVTQLMKEAEEALQELKKNIDPSKELDNDLKIIQDELKARKELEAKKEELYNKAMSGIEEQKGNIEELRKEVSKLKEEFESRAASRGVSNKPAEIPKEAAPSKSLSIPVYVSDRDIAIKKLQSSTSAFGDNYIVIGKDNDRSLVFKDRDGSVVSITYDDTRIKQSSKERPEVAYRSVEELWMDITKNTSRVEKILPDGTIVSINGSAKNAYYAKYKEMVAKDRLAKFLTKAGRRYQKLNDPKLKGEKIKTNIDLTSERQAIKIIAEINSRKESIISATQQYFNHLLGSYFKDYDDFFRNINEVLPEMLVAGDTNAPIFKKEYPPEVKENMVKFINYLINRDTKLVSMNNKLELNDYEISAMDFEKYNKIFILDDTGNIEYNTGVGGLFEGVDPREKILELVLNQHQISEGKYKGYLEDVALFQEVVVGHVPIDRQNGMAMELALKDNPKDIEFAESLGFISRDEDGNILTTVQDFINGLKFVLGELYNNNSKYDKKRILDLLDKLGSENVLPQREHLNPSGTRENLPVKPIDFILFNAENRKVDAEDLFTTFAKYVNMLDDYAQKALSEEGKFVEANKLNLEQKEFNKKTSDAILSTLSSIRKVIDSQNRANPYMQTQKYTQMKEQLIKNIEYLVSKNYIDYDTSKIENIKAQTYNGNLNNDNFINTVKGIVEYSDNDELMASSVLNRSKEVRSILGRKKLLGDIAKDKTYKDLIKSIKDYASKSKLDQEIIDNLDSKNAVLVRQAIKQIELKAEGIMKDTKEMRNFIEELSDSGILPTDYMSNQRNRTKIKSFIDRVEGIIGDVEGLDEVKSFVDYYGNEYDYKLDKQTWLKDIDALISEVSKLKEASTDGDYKSKRGNFKALSKAYSKLKTLINENVSMNSLKFIKKNTKEELLNGISDLKNAGKDLGISTNQLEAVATMLSNLMEVLDLVDESKTGTPIIRKQRGNIEKFSRVTNAEKQKFGRLEGVINKNIWLKDKGMFVRVSPEKIERASKAGFFMDDETIELETIPWEDLSDNVEGTFDKYVAPEFKQKFKNLYEYAVEFFSPVRELVDGKVNERPLTLDEFTRIYVHFLRDLSNTTDNAKIQSTMDPIKQSVDVNIDTQGSNKANPLRSAMYLKNLTSYFDSDEDMIAFFTRRQGTLGGEYVKSNRKLIEKYTTKHGEALAEIATVGNSLSRFGYQLKHKDKALMSLMKKYEPVVFRDDNTIIDKKTVDVTTNIATAIGSKLSNYATPVYAGYGVKGYTELEADVKQWVKGALTVTRDTILMAKGVIEMPARLLRTVRDTMRVDSNGNVVGAKNIASLNLKQIYALAKGTGYGFAAALTTPYNLGIQTLNMAGKFGQYLKIEKAINNLFKKYGIDPIELRVSKRYEVTPISILKRIHPKKKAMLTAMKNYFEMRDLNKTVAMDGFDPTDFKVLGSDEKWAYVKSGGRSVYDMYSRKANLIQEYSDMVGWIGAYESVNDILMDMSNKPYSSLSEDAKSWLNIVGIDEAAYPRLINTINKLKNSNGKLDDINILDPEIAKGNLKIDEILEIDNLKSLSNTIFLDAFDQNKAAKFRPRDKGNLLSEIMMTLRHTVYSMGEDDMNDFLYKATPYGTFESKRSSYQDYGTPSNWKDKAKIGSVHATGILCYLGAAAVAPMVKAVAENLWRLAGEYSNARSTIQTFSEITSDEDEDFKEKFVKSVNLIREFAWDSMQNNIPLMSLFNDGNILANTLGLFKETIDAFLDLSAPILGISTEDARKVLKKLGVDSEYNEYEAGRQPFSTRALSFVKALLGDTLLRSERDYTKAFTKEGREEERKKFLRRQKRNKVYGNTAAAYYINNYSEDSEEIDTDVNFGRAVERYNAVTPEEQLERAESIYYIYSKDYDFALQSQEDSLRGESLALIDELEKNGNLDSKTAEAAKVKIMKDMKIDDEIKQLPSAYQYVIKQVLKTHDGISESNEIALKATMLQEAMRESELSEIYEKYARKEYTPREEYESYSDIPSAYKLYYKKLKDYGLDISQTEFLEKINSPSGKNWLSSMFDENGNVDLPGEIVADTYTLDEIVNPQFEITNDGILQPKGHIATNEELEVVNKKEDLTMFMSDEDVTKLNQILSDIDLEAQPIEDNKTLDNTSRDIIEAPQTVEDIIDDIIPEENMSEEDKTIVKDLENKLEVADKVLGVQSLSPQSINEAMNTIQENEDNITPEVEQTLVNEITEDIVEEVIKKEPSTNEEKDVKPKNLLDKMKKKYKEKQDQKLSDNKEDNMENKTIEYKDSTLYNKLKNDNIDTSSYELLATNLITDDNFTKSMELGKDINDENKLKSVEKKISNSYRTLSKESFFDKLDDVRKAALVDLTYTVPNWTTSFKKAVAALKNEDYNKAASEILDSKYAKNNPDRAGFIAMAVKYGGGNVKSFQKEKIPLDFLLDEAENSEEKSPFEDSILKTALQQDYVDLDNYKKWATDILSTKFTRDSEGFVGHVYKDGKGIDTIGYGSNIDPDRGSPFSKERIEKWKKANYISKEEATEIFNEKFEEFTKKIENEQYYKDADPVRQGALRDIAYNMGVGWTKKFPSAFAALKSGDYQKAAEQLLYNINKKTGEKTKTGYYKDTGIRAEKIALLLTYGAGDVEEFTQSPTPTPESDTDVTK